MHFHEHSSSHTDAVRTRVLQRMMDLYHHILSKFQMLLERHPPLKPDRRAYHGRFEFPYGL